MPVLSRELDEPIILYKMVRLADGAFGVAKLSVPKGETLVQTDYSAEYRGRNQGTPLSWLVRVGSATPISITPVGKPGQFMMSGASIKRPAFKYTLGLKVKSPIDTASSKGNGIHGFLDEASAKMWPLLFGR